MLRVNAIPQRGQVWELGGGQTSSSSKNKLPGAGFQPRNQIINPTHEIRNHLNRARFCQRFGTKSARRDTNELDVRRAGRLPIARRIPDDHHGPLGIARPCHLSKILAAGSFAAEEGLVPRNQIEVHSCPTELVPRAYGSVPGQQPVREPGLRNQRERIVHPRAA